MVVVVALADGVSKQVDGELVDAQENVIADRTGQGSSGDAHESSSKGVQVREGWLGAQGTGQQSSAHFYLTFGERRWLINNGP